MAEDMLAVLCVCANQMKDGCASQVQMKDGTIFGTKEAHVRATTPSVRQSFEPFLFQNFSSDACVTINCPGVS